MKGELFINGYDADTRWGLSLGNGARAALWSPARNKDYIKNSSRLEHGTRADTTMVRNEERTITLQMYIRAKSMDEFCAHLLAFIAEVLDTGRVNIKTKYQPGVVYKCLYEDFTQFSEFNGRLGKFILKVTELNPKDRSEQ